MSGLVPVDVLGKRVYRIHNTQQGKGNQLPLYSKTHTRGAGNPKCLKFVIK